MYGAPKQLELYILASPWGLGADALGRALSQQQSKGEQSAGRRATVSDQQGVVSSYV